MGKTNIKKYKKNIYKIEKIHEIFLRSKKFSHLSESSKYFYFPKVLKKDESFIYYELIDFKKYISWYSKEQLTKEDIIFFVKALFEFYQEVNQVQEFNINKKYILHGDLHLRNIFVPIDSNKKILFLDPETPNSYSFELFTHNKILFEISYMLYHLDNHWPIWNFRFYKNNFSFKKIFTKEIEEYFNIKDKKQILSEIQKSYISHIKRKFEFTVNPVLFLHRVYRFLIIYFKFVLWKIFIKY